MNAPPAFRGGSTALQAAAGGGHLVALHALLKAGTDVHALPAEEGGRTALQAAEDGGHRFARGILPMAAWPVP